MNKTKVNKDRAFTNLLTGSVHLFDFPSNAVFKYVLNRKLPRIFLPSFLHEATHFWCMASELGSLIALLELRVFLELGSDSPRRDRFLHDWSALQLARQMLQPLLEGMALFQEFDAFPGQSDVYSSPGYWAGILFRPLDEETIKLESQQEILQWQTDQVFRVLGIYRSSETAIKRKISTLMRSLTQDSHGYLSGYLTVKNLWFLASLKTPAFQDRDLFLSFLRFWVFNDWVLIGYLADSDSDIVKTANLIFQRIQSRFLDLIANDLTHEVSIYDREVGSGSNDGYELLKSLCISESEYHDGRLTLETLYNEIRSNPENSEHEAWSVIEDNIIEHRNRYMRLQLEPITIEINKHGRAIVFKGDADEYIAEKDNVKRMKSVYLGGPAPEGYEPGITPGLMTIYFIPDQLSLVLLSSQGGEPITWFPNEVVPDPEKASVRKIMAVVSTFEEQFQQFSLIAENELLAMNNTAQEILHTIFNEQIINIYSNYALVHVDDEKRIAEIKTLLDRKGLYDLLEKDGDLLTTLVAISLYSVVDEEGKIDLRGALKEDGIDFDKALQRILEIQNRVGIELVHVFSNSVIWSNV